MNSPPLALNPPVYGVLLVGGERERGGESWKGKSRDDCKGRRENVWVEKIEHGRTKWG